jgi:hypothetical protein
MKKSKDFNNISEELLEKVKLKKGETATFKLLSIRPDPYNQGRFIIPQAVSIREFDSVYDPGKKEYVDIANIISIDREGKVTAAPIYFTKEEQGILNFSGDYQEDVLKATYLRLSSYNETNENRNKSTRARFFEINPVADAEKSRATRAAKLTAMTTAAAMSDEEAKDMYAALGQDSNEKPLIIREYLEKLAETNPDQFNLHYSDKSRSVKATIKKACDAGHIALDTAGAKFTWAVTSETIFTFAKKAGVEPYSEFADFILTSKGGDKILEEIKKGLNAKKK